MSGIAGIFHVDGRPAAFDDVAAMTAAMAHRGPDGIHQWAAGPVGLGHCLFRTTEQSLAEAQPVRSEAPELGLVMDGRVDNRDDLVAALGPARDDLRDGSDPELVLRCYQRWGLAGITRIVGDFAFALWDGARQELVCARDFLGKRPFYYASTKSTFRFASEPQAVLVDPSVPREPNEAMIAEFLSMRLSNSDATMYRSMARLPPAHYLVVSARGARLLRYWEWDPGLEVRHSSDEEYAEHLLDLCAQAVRARIGGPWRQAVSLSGGVDSSSVVGVIASLGTGALTGGDIDVYSMVFPGRSCDETRYVDAVAEHHQLDVRRFQPGPFGPAPYDAQVHRYLDLPDYPSTMAHTGYWAEARQRGCRSVFTGAGPDEWLAGSYLLADALRRGHVREVGARLQAEIGTPTPRGMARHLWRYGVKPLVPAPARRALRSATGRRTIPDHIRPAWATSVGLDAQVEESFGRRPSFAVADLAGRLVSGWHAHAYEMAERANAWAGLELRDPFDDRRVVEFALAVPEDQRRRDSVTKYMLRQAMVGLVPEPVRARRDKANYAYVFAAELESQDGAALFADLDVDRRGWVDGSRVQAMYAETERNYRAGQAFHRHLWYLWMVASVERWLGATITSAGTHGGIGG